MIKTVIIDDEQHCIDRLEQIIQKYCPQLQIAGKCSSIPEGLDNIRALKPELVFLDIQVGKETAFDLLNALKEINFDIIFTTAFEHYAVQAFKFSALEYLLKPIDAEDLIPAVAKVEQKIYREETAQKLDVLMQNMEAMQFLSKKIAISTLSGIVFVAIREIIRCEARINYTDIYLTGNRKMTVSKTLKDFEDLLGYQHFFRIHKTHLVNLNYIKSYQKGKGGSVKLEDQTELEVSTRRKDSFLKKLAELGGG